MSRMAQTGQVKQIDSAFWNDPYVQGDETQRGLDITERYLFIFLLTGPLSNIAGVYPLPINTFTAMTGLTREQLLVILQRFEKDGKVLYKNGWVAVKNRKEYNKQDNPSIRKGIAKILAAAPSFCREFVEKDTKTHPEKQEKGESLLHGVDTVPTPSPHPVISIKHPNTDIDKDIDIDNLYPPPLFEFFREHYEKATRNGSEKGRFLSLTTFEEKDLQKLVDEHPAPGEVYRAWVYYCWHGPAEWNETITVANFVRKFNMIDEAARLARKGG